MNAPSAKAYINHRIHPAQTIKDVLDYDRSVISDNRVKLRIINGMEAHPMSPTGETDFGFQTIKTSIRQVWHNTYVAPGMYTFLMFLAHLSTTCSRGAFGIMLCQLCIMHRPSSTIFWNISQTLGQFTPNFAGMFIGGLL